MPPVIEPHRVGYLARHPDFPSRQIDPRTVEVWLPSEYMTEPERRFPVIYMHDGQNLWHPTATTGVAWDVDLALARLIAAGVVPPAIIVAVPSHPTLRFMEYMPQAPCETEEGRARVARLARRSDPTRAMTDSQIISDRYLAFLATELKPFIDATYRTLPDAPDTLLMGSSMGGLISLYAPITYGEIFGAAACLSTHWPALEGLVVKWLPGHLPDPATHRLYFDFGTEGVDEPYAVYQARVDALLIYYGYQAGANWETRPFMGAEHREQDWAARVHIPLRFLLAR